VALALRLTWLGRPREADPMLPYRAKSITEPKGTILLPIARCARQGRARLL